MTDISFAPTPVFYVFIGFVFGMAIGWAIGFFDSNNRTAKKIEAAESKADLITKEAENKIALASQTTSGAQDDPGLLRLKNESGHFTLEMDGALVDGALSSDRKKRLIELITIFRPWIEGGHPSQAASQPAALPVHAPPVPAPVQPAVSRFVPPVTVKKPEAEKNITSLSIVNQIDTVLQARLVNTPLEKQGIRLQESLQGGVEVYVGLQKFLSVDDVPDTFIKSEIRAAIAEWEDKYTPGL